MYVRTYVHTYVHTYIHASRKNSSHGVMAGTCGNIRWPFLAKWRDGSNLTGTAANAAENDETSVEKMMMNQDQPVSVYFLGFPNIQM